MSEKTQKFRPVILKSLFILMILVIIVLLAFAVIRFIPFIFSSFASVGNSFKSPFEKSLEIKLSEDDLDSEETFRLYWEYAKSSETEDGSYNLKYDCAPNLKLHVASENKTELFCDTGYKLNKGDRFIDLTGILNKENSYTESKVKVSFLDKSGLEVSSDSLVFSITNEGDIPINDLSGSASISSQDVSGENNSGSIESNSNSNGSNTNAGSNNSGSTSGTTYTNNNFSNNIPADLAVVNMRAVNDTQIVFDVTNLGGRPTGNWIFNYTIPGEDVETSPTQPNLNPGNTIRYTLTFSDIDSEDVVVYLDPTNLIRENSETNNLRTVPIRGDGGSSNNSNRNSNNNSYNRNDDADLEIRNLEVGYTDRSRFREEDDIDDNDDAAVRFEVTNRGGESTGSWRFEIEETPYDGSNNDYRSSRQDSLRPGESTVITVEFENPDEGRYDIEVTVDSDDDVDEEDERNNDESEDLRVRD